MILIIIVIKIYMSLLIDKHTLYYDYRLFKLKVCDIEFEEDMESILSDRMVYRFNTIYRHNKILAVTFIIIFINTILLSIISGINETNKYIPMFSLLNIFLIFINFLYSNKTIYITSKYNPRQHFIDPIITYKIIDKKDNNYELYIYYNGLSYDKYYKESIKEINKELNKYIIPDISKLITSF